MTLEVTAIREMENIDQYYRSLKEIYDYLVDWKEPPGLRRQASSVLFALEAASVVCLLLTVIPVLPFTLSIGLPRLDRGLTSLAILGLRLEPLMQYWVLCLVGSVASTYIFDILANYVEPPSSPPKYSLSADQVSFILVYMAFEELRLYLIDNLTEHVDKATNAIRKLLRPPFPPRLYRRVPTDVRLARAYSRLPGSAMARQLQITSEFLNTYQPYDWFRMDEQAETTLRALTSIPSKIYTRLVVKQDLPKLKTILEHLARWIYAYLPELEASRAPEQLQALRQAGDREAAQFAAEMEGLTEYELPSPPVPDETPRRPSIIRRILESEHMLVRFLRYFIFILILTSALSLVAVQVFGVQRDSAILTTISTSVLGGATLAVVPTLIKRERKT